MIEGKKIKGYEGYIYTEREELYRLPFTNKGRSYPLRKLRMQDKNRWYVNGKYLSKKMIEGILLMSKD